LLRLKNGEPFTFAGIWETWKGDGDAIDSCAIITTEANDLSRPIHDCMPVIRRGADAEAWVDPGIGDAKTLVPLLRPFSADEMVAFPVSTRVNKVGDNDARLIEIEK
jgi:putative SOS response-associated peptidase YedK